MSVAGSIECAAAGSSDFDLRVWSKNRTDDRAQKANSSGGTDSSHSSQHDCGECFIYQTFGQPTDIAEVMHAVVDGRPLATDRVVRRFVLVRERLDQHNRRGPPCC